MSVPDPYLWPEDFLDAHRRHWEDAELLFREGRLANADHLYGMSAECGLKYLLIRLGVPLSRQERLHVNELWNHFRRLPSARRFPEILGWLGGNPFYDWRVDQRYAHRTRFDRSRVEDHRKGALKVWRLLARLGSG